MIGVLTGIFECGLVLALVYFIPTLNQAEWKDLLGYGIGYGATEALCIGLLYSVYLIKNKYIEDPKKESSVKILPSIPVKIVERVFTLFIHVYSCVLIFIAVQQNAYRYFWLSFAFKTLVDAIAGWLILEKNARTTTKASQQWAHQSIFILLGLISLFATIRLSPY